MCKYLKNIKTVSSMYATSIVIILDSLWYTDYSCCYTNGVTFSHRWYVASVQFGGGFARFIS